MDCFGLGFVDVPDIGHEMYRGRIVIPYYGATGVLADVRFRSVPGPDGTDSSVKMLGLPGHPPRLYNPAALMDDLTYVCVCEGEFDTMTAVQCGLSAVGVPGVKAWNRPMAKLLRDYHKVFILADGDEAGKGFAKEVSRMVRNCLIVPLPEGEDVNSFVMAKGRDALIDLMGIED